jgi:hypothetical protein
METVKQIKIPIIAHPVWVPDFFYGDCTGIYFVTEDDKYGRITFENLDAIKICRGEGMPYEFDYKLYEQGVWIYQIENSNWQKERFNYENKYYGKVHEFGGNVNDMLTDFKHYLFQFHDQFIEIIARGFWFEKDDQSLFKKELMEGHPFLPLPTENMKIMEAYSLKSQIRINPKPHELLAYGAQFCSQKLFEFALELDGNAVVDNTVSLSCRNGKMISQLGNSLRRKIVEFEGCVNLEQVKPFIEKYMKEVYKRRKNMRQ